MTENTVLTCAELLAAVPRAQAARAQALSAAADIVADVRERGGRERVGAWTCRTLGCW